MINISQKQLYTGILWAVRIFFVFMLPLFAAVTGLYVYSHGGSIVETENAYVKADIVIVSPEVSSRVTNVEVEDKSLLFLLIS